MIRAGVVGASGYTGLECCRLLSQHPNVTLTHIYSSQYGGQTFGTIYPHLVDPSLGDLVFSVFDETSLDDVDVLFLALPHGKSHEYTSLFTQTKVKVIDLSADFRLSDEDTFNNTYGVAHTQPDRLSDVVYGLPELYREDIVSSQYVANPGCYTTAAILSLAPLTRNHLLEGDIVIDSKSGASGAGKKVSASLQFCEVNESFHAYGTGVHRHAPEIEQEISYPVFFSPHLLPISRGILSTAYVTLKEGVTEEDIQSSFSCYDQEPFTHLRRSLTDIKISSVVHSNNCLIAYKVFPKHRRLVVISVIDNVLKGASGQAIQNMNIMFGFPETEGLPQFSTYF